MRKIAVKFYGSRNCITFKNNYTILVLSGNYCLYGNAIIIPPK